MQSSCSVFKKNDIVEVTGIKGTVLDVICYESGEFGYVVDSAEYPWLKRHVIVEAAVSLATPQ